MRWDVLALIVATGIAISGTALIILRVDPYGASLGHLFLFYFALLISMWGIIMLVSYGARRLILKNYIHENLFASAFFHGMFGALAIIIFLLVKKFIL
jgi:hypothetical protein